MLLVSVGLRVEFVADTPHRLDSNTGSVKFIAHMCRVYIHGAGLSVKIEAPYKVQQLLTAQDNSLIFRQHHEQIELFGPQINLTVSNMDGTARRINGHISDVQRSGRLRTARLGAAQNCFYARYQFTRVTENQT